MPEYTVNNESGFPSAYDNYTSSSETTGKSSVQFPEEMTTVSQSAILNKHQNQHETRPVGVPGTTWEPDQSDHVWTSEGGHKIVYGNKAGAETLSILSKQGAAIEMDANGAMKITGKNGVHIATNGDGHFVLTGDVHFVTNGDFRFKGSSVHFDCDDFNVHAKGDIIQNAEGSINQHSTGDIHITAQADVSTMAGGNMRMTTAGDLTTQASGDAAHTAKGKMSLGSVGDCSVSTQGKLNTTSAGDTTISAKGKTSVNSEGDITVTGKAKMTLASGGEAKLSSKGKLTVVGDGVDLGGSGALKLSGSTIDAQSGANKASPDWVGGGSASKPSAADANPEVKKPDITVPDAEAILDDVGDTYATKGEQSSINTSYDLDNDYDVEDGGKIPDEVMKRAKQKGVIDQSYQPTKEVDVGEIGSTPMGGFGYSDFHFN